MMFIAGGLTAGYAFSFLCLFLLTLVVNLTPRRSFTPHREPWTRERILRILPLPLLWLSMWITYAITDYFGP